MSGPVGTVDASPTDTQASAVKPACVEITPSRESVVGAMRVRRALPRIGRRTVGAWCFADHMGPELVTETHGLDIGPHPHTGLQTVTWLVAGEVLHRDSLGSEQLIRAGQLNLMTAGQGVTHSEEATGHYRGQLHGVQLWMVQPEATRHGVAAFEHHATLPQVELDNAIATILVGELAGAASPARRDTPWSAWTWRSGRGQGCGRWSRPSSTPWSCWTARYWSASRSFGRASWPTSEWAARSWCCRRPSRPGCCCWAASRSVSRC
jgi:redox-sensitive bicupin YhaK (pirin superfamily)